MKRAMITTAFTILAMGTAAVALSGPAVARGEGMGQRMIEQLDTNKDGQISQEEFLATRQERFANADADGDGQLSSDEIQALSDRFREARGGKGAHKMRGPDPQKMIEHLDSDGDGLLSAQELAAAPQRSKMFDRLDADGDGVISKEEFEAAREMMRKRFGDRHAGGAGHPHWKKN